MAADLIPISIRIALRNAIGGWGPYTLREIDELFISHGFSDCDDGNDDVGGARRTRAEAFQSRIDFSSSEQTLRYLDLVDEVLEQYPESEDPPIKAGQDIRRALRREGIVRGVSGRLQLPGGAEAAERALEESARGIWTAERIRIFMSHTSPHRIEVADLADELNKEAFSCFVAHDAIEPTREWQEVIELALRTCDVLIAYVTHDFNASSWTDQEVGWALGREIIVIPLSVDADPYGFFGAYQAVRLLEGQRVTETAAAVGRAIAVATFRQQRSGALRLLGRMTNLVVDAFCRSGNSAAVSRRYQLLMMIPPVAWSEDLLDVVEQSMRENRHIQEAEITESGRQLPEILQEMIARNKATF